MLICQDSTFSSREGDEATSLSFAAENGGIDTLARHWKCSLQLGICSGDPKGSTLPTTNKYLSAGLLLLTNGGGQEGTSPSF